MTVYRNSILSVVDPDHQGMMDEDRLEAIVLEKQRLLRHNPSPNPQVFSSFFHGTALKDHPASLKIHL